MPEPTDAQTRVYELVAILPANLKEKDLEDVKEDLKKMIAKQKGEVFVEDVWERRPLAYRIKGADEGIYYIVNFRMDPAKLVPLGKSMRLETKSLRVFLTRMPDDYAYADFVQAEKAAVEREEELAPGLAAKTGSARANVSSLGKARGRPAAKTAAKKTTEEKKSYDASKLDSALQNIDKSI